MGRYSFPCGEVAESIATALSVRKQRPIDRGQVIVEPTSNAGQYWVTVYETAEFANQVIPFLDRDGSIPTSLGDLCLVGYRTNRHPALMNPWQHGQFVGATGSGKSSLLHVMVAHVTRCPQCFIWVGGKYKLYDFVSSWLEPYLNTGFKPPIDWVAHGQQDVCNMIAAYLNMAAYRLNLRNNQRVGIPYGVLILDEVTYIVSDRTTKCFVNGDWLNASQGIAGIARGTAGAKQSLWLATQRDTFDNLGDEGGTTAAQMGFAFVFRIRDQGTIGRVTGDYSLDIPRGDGECWADMGLGEPIAKLRVPYPQADDPLKRVLHDGPKVSEIAWSRRFITHEVDAGSAAAAGEHYLNRHQLVTEEYLDYLTSTQTSSSAASNSISVTSASSAVKPVEHDSVLSEAERIYQRWVAQALVDNGHVGAQSSNGSQATAVAVLPEEPSNVVQTGRFTTRKARVIAVCEASATPLTRAEIITELERMGDTVSNPNAVTNILGECVQAERLGRTEDGRYYAV